MAKERRDSKNRLLGKGEYQKEDGRYMYRYTDINGKARFVYSWTLVKTDRTPKGRTPGVCLRDLEKQIADQLNNGIDIFTASKTTVNDYFEKFLSTKKKIKHTTRRGYRHKYDLYIRERIGNREISTIKFTDICSCYADILDKCGIAESTLSICDAALRQTFNLAKRDNLIRDNPVSSALIEVARSRESNKTQKDALTPQQQEVFLNFLGDSKVYSKWKNFYTVMLWTGCRVGEVCGLTWDDCDFDNNVIHIRRTVGYAPNEVTGKYVWYVQSPKTCASVRDIPMFSVVRDALQDERRRSLVEGFCKTVIDDVSGFVFQSRFGNAIIPNEANKILTRVVNAYNKKETMAAEIEHRKPFLLQDFTPHTLRHTFCTRMCASGLDLKVIQRAMGHSNIAMTMDVYNNITTDYMQESFKSIDSIITA